MSLPTASGSAECPGCYQEMTLKDVMRNEIVQCAGCGLDLEVIELEPLALETAPEEEEDWGE